MIESKGTKIDWRELYANEIGRLNQITRVDAKNRVASFSARNPALGKMVTCRFCGTRTRGGGLRNGLPCCNAKLQETAIAPDWVATPNFISSNKWTWNQITEKEGDGQWELPEKVRIPAEQRMKRRRKPRLTRHHPPLFLMHDLIKQWEGDENLVAARKLQDAIEGLPHFWTPTKPLEVAQLASFAEKVVVRRNKATARRKRLMQQRSRRINFGLAA